MPKLETKIIAYLSHRPKLYSLIVGMGIVLFWRGVWHTTDQVHNFYANNLWYSTMSLTGSPWWDGPLSLVVGMIILYFTGSLISSFIGNELILSGLRGEKRLNEKTEVEVHNEVRAISDIKDSLRAINQTLEQLEKKVLDYHVKK